MASGTTITILAAFLAAAAIGAQPSAIRPQAEVLTATPEQEEMAEWALSRYEAAGLRLPPLIIEFAGRDLSGCGDAQGRAYPREVPALVRMCWNDSFLLLHELAHVWEAHNIPAAKHRPFMAMRSEVDSWAGSGIAWTRQGREHAANVIAWGVLDEPRPVTRTYPNDPDSLRTAFEFLTGTEPLHDGGPGIQEPDRDFFTPERSNAPLESGR